MKARRTPEFKPDLLDRIHAMCTDEGECWVWQGPVYVGKHGRYPRLSFDGQQWLVRRLALTIKKPPTSEGMRIKDTCSESLCCNPAHLRWQTMAAQNRAREWSKVTRMLHATRVSRGIKNGKRLSLPIAREIRAIGPSSLDERAAVAKRYGVNIRTIEAVLYHETWLDPVVEAMRSA